MKQKFRVFETLHAKAILGLDFLRENKIRRDFENMTLTIPIPRKPSDHNNNNGSPVTIATIRDNGTVMAMAKTINSVILQPHSETILPVKIHNFSPGTTVI